MSPCIHELPIPCVMSHVRYGISHHAQNITGKKVLQLSDSIVRTYSSTIPSLPSWLSLLRINTVINRLEALT